MNATAEPLVVPAMGNGQIWSESGSRSAEEALRESERRFREMIDALPAAIYTTDAEGRLTHFNRAAVEFSGRVPELGTDHWCVSWKLYYPDGTPMPHDKCPMAIALKEGRAVRGVEAIAERPDGKRVWFTPYPTPLRDTEGRIVGGINMLVEITERKLAEQANALLGAIVDSSDDAIISKDLNGVIMSWNQSAERLFGYTAEEAIGQSITILIPAERRDEEPKILERLRRGERVDHYETVRVRKDGSQLNISLTISPVKDGQGRVMGVSKIARDVTERKRAEHAIRKNNERLQILSEALAHLLSAQNAAKMLRELFPKVAAHLGLDTYFNYMLEANGLALRLHSYAGIARQSAREIDRLQFGQGICGTVAQTKQTIVATDILNSDYDKASLVRNFGIQACVCHPLMSGKYLLGTLSFASRTRTHFEEDELEFLGLIARYVAVAMERVRSEEALREAHDLLTDKAKHLDALVQQRTAKLQEVIGELESFSYSISHDMRAPLRAMQSFAKILDEECGEKVGPEGKDYIRRIIAGADRMDKLIMDVLRYSRLTRTEYELGPVELERLLRGILESYPAFHRPQAEIELAGTFPNVTANEAALTQCISNLLGNAVKFVSGGTVPRVQVWAERRNGDVRLFVQDNGIGIPSDADKKIFGIFQRFTKDYEGTGIGLAIVRKAVERMGGQVGYKSEPGKGSTFWLELKAANENA